MSTDSNDPTPCMAKTAAISDPRVAAEDDSDVTVAAKGYSPPTPAPRKNRHKEIWPYIVSRGVSKQLAEPKHPTVMSTAVAMNIFLRPTTSANEPATT